MVFSVCGWKMFLKGTFGLILLIVLLTALMPIALAHDLPSWDLSDYIRPYEQEVLKLVESIGLKPLLSHPLENARIAYYWISENIRYMYDKQRWGSDEYWQLPSTTINLGTGDCEDQAILLASLLRALKLPRENVRIVIGPTSHGNYHAWIEIKLPLPIYGLEAAAARALELLRNKKVAVSIGEVSFNQSITGDMIADLKAKGLSQRNGWIPLDTTVKIFGLPVPFSWWLTYGYNVYDFLGCKVSPQQTFQDRARIWSVDRIVKSGESISFDIPCVNGDKILGVIKAKNTLKEQVLNIQAISGWYNVRFGPCYIGAGETLRFEWEADRPVSIYILNQADRSNWFGIGAPSSYRCKKTAQAGFLEYTTKHADNFYVVVCHWQSFVIYKYTIKRLWQETACNIKVLVSNPQGRSMTTVSITQREVEKHFNFTAEESGVYKVVLKNIGESTPIYMRIEEYSTPLSLELAGISEDLVIAEQEYINRIAEVIGNNAEGSDTLIWPPLLNITLALIPVVVLFAVVFVLLKYKKKSYAG